MKAQLRWNPEAAARRSYAGTEGSGIKPLLHSWSSRARILIL